MRRLLLRRPLRLLLPLRLVDVAQPLKVSFTPNLVVSGNYVLSFTALDPKTGAVVPGVKISEASVTGVDLNARAAANAGDVPEETPWLVPEE